jgi:hypothetical protein
MVDDDIASYRSVPILIYLTGFSLAWTFFAVVAGSRSPSALLLGVIGAAFAWTLTLHHTYQAALHRNGALEFRSLLRHRQTSARAVRNVRARRGDGETRFVITFDEGAAAIRGNHAAHQLVEAILTINPAVELKGYKRRA